MPIFTSILSAFNGYLAATGQAAVSGFSSYVLPMFIDIKANTEGTTEIPEEVLTQTLKKLSCVRIDGQPFFTNFEGKDSQTGRLQIRNTFKIALAEEAKKLRLPEQESRVLDLLGEDDYVNLLQKLKSARPAFPENFISAVKAAIIGASDLLDELQEGLLEELDKTQTQIAALQATRQQATQANIEVLRLREELARTKAENLQLKEELAQAQITKTLGESREGSPQPSTADMMPPPPPPPPPPSPKPPGMSVQAAASFNEVLKQLQENPANRLKKTIIKEKVAKQSEVDDDWTPSKRLAKLRKEKEERKLQEAQLSEPESPEIRRAKVSVIMGKNRVVRENTFLEKADKKLKNIEDKIIGLKVVITKAEEELKEKNRAKITEKKELQPLKDAIEKARARIMVEQKELERAEKEQQELLIELDKAKKSLSSSEEKLATLKEQYKQQLEVVETPTSHF